MLKLFNFNGYASMITPTAWLYNPTYAAMRKNRIECMEICNLVELGSDAFEVGFGTTMFTFMHKKAQGYIGTYFDIKNEIKTENSATLHACLKYPYNVKMEYFREYDGLKFSYKLTKPYRRVLQNSRPLSYYGNARAGLQTDDNARFIREWYEVDVAKIDFHHKKGTKFGNEKWFPHIKGGTYHKWYGNLSSVVNWQHDGTEIKANASKKYGSYTKRVQSMEYYFCAGLAWTHTTYSQPFACRYIPEGIISNVEGPEIFDLGNHQLDVLGMLNSKVMDSIYTRMSDSIHYLAGELANFPVKLSNDPSVDKLCLRNIELARSDWDAYETSWDFKRNPMLNRGKIADAYTAWKADCESRFLQLMASEEELNRIFIDIYGLQDELTPEVEDKDVTVHRVFDTKDDVPESMKGSNYVRTMRDEIVSLISYAVGCMFGRYSLDTDGLAYAGGEWDASKYQTFMPDNDNIIPICDDDYFDDDVTGRFIKWVATVYGADTLEENLKFIASALGGKGSAREVIRNYFISDFYADHLKTYQKRPIYWLFDSGKKNGFKCLIYMHRYQPDTIARIRTDYVHEQQSRYRTAIADLQQRINGASTGDRVKLTKQLTKLEAQAEEIRTYEEKIHHLADQMIFIDLDDGVKVNYAKFADVLAKIK